MIEKKGLSSVPGFQFSVTTYNQKKPNMGLLYSTAAGTIGAAVFTRNDIQAAPVLLSKRNHKGSGHKRAILVNSGNANAFTGKSGIAHAEQSLETLGKNLKIPANQCYVASTGVIGQLLPIQDILGKIPELVSKLNASQGEAFAQAILTTDTHSKEAAIQFQLDGKDVIIAACAKGAGMIMPNMATMLCFMATDAHISYEMLQLALEQGIDESFNSITIDSDTSTNDSVFLLANGLANHQRIAKPDSDFSLFAQKLKELMQHLAWEIVADAEGVTKKISIEVLTAVSALQAKTIAFAIANSPLVKTAFFGQQLNWGRIVMAAGKAMTGIQAELLDVRINSFEVVKKGEPIYSVYKQAEESLAKDTIEIQVNLNLGSEKKKVWTSDLSLDYVKINANYIS